MARPSPAMAAETARGARHGAGKAAAPLREVKAGGSECGEDFVVSLLQGGNVVMRLVADDHPRRDAEGRLHLAVKVHPDVSDVGLGVAPGTLAPGTIVDVYPSDDTTAIVVTVPDLECRSEATRGKSD